MSGVEAAQVAFLVFLFRKYVKDHEESDDVEERKREGLFLK